MDKMQTYETYLADTLMGKVELNPATDASIKVAQSAMNANTELAAGQEPVTSFEAYCEQRKAAAELAMQQNIKVA